MTTSRFNIEDRVAVVTGGNGLLGTEYVKTLAEAGARVAVIDITPSLNEKLTTLKNSGHNIEFYRADITNKNDVTEVYKSVSKKWGIPTILINNAAVDTPLTGDHGNRSFGMFPLEVWETALRVNLAGMFLCCQIFGSAMAAQKTKRGGSIINISSTYGIVAPHQEIYAYKEKKGEPFYEKPITYSTTKAGVIGMTRWLATYWAKRGVRVNALAPGGVFAKQDPEFLAGYEGLTPMGRMAEKYEYNDAILFLASDASSYMTGSVITIDGGWTAW